MDVLVADLHEDATALSEQVAGGDEAVAQVGQQVGQVGVDAQLPGVAERLDLLDLAGGVLELAVLDVALAGGDLPVGAELDACLLYTSPSPRDRTRSRMPSSA